jgi:hypothetical protein
MAKLAAGIATDRIAITAYSCGDRTSTVDSGRLGNAASTVTWAGGQWGTCATDRLPVYCVRSM